MTPGGIINYLDHPGISNAISNLIFDHMTGGRTFVIALIAHDGMKPEMVHFVQENKHLLAKAKIVATGTTGGHIQNIGLEVDRLLSGPKGGDAQIASRIADAAVTNLGCYKRSAFIVPRVGHVNTPVGVPEVDQSRVELGITEHSLEALERSPRYKRRSLDLAERRFNGFGQAS